MIVVGEIMGFENIREIKSLRGFVSDMDGVVADTEEFWYAGTRKFLQAFGVEYSREEFGQCVGKPPIENSRMFKEKYGLPLSENDAHKARLNEVMAALNTGLKLNDGYIDLLLILEKNRIRTSLASNSPLEIINKILDTTKIRRYFTAIVSADQVGNKVEAYRLAVKSMHLKIAECFALEDSLSGVRAAKEAGLYCIAVPSQFANGADFSIANEIHKNIRTALQNSPAIKRARTW